MLIKQWESYEEFREREGGENPEIFEKLEEALEKLDSSNPIK